MPIALILLAVVGVGLTITTFIVTKPEKPQYLSGEAMRDLKRARGKKGYVE